MNTMINSVAKNLGIFKKLCILDRIQVVLFFSLLLLFCLRLVPFNLAWPAPGLDPSWAFGLAYALGHGLTFGSDIIFTFGPYNTLYTHCFTPDSDIFSLVSGMFLFLCYSGMLCALYTRKTSFYLILLLFFFVNAPQDPFFMIYPFLFFRTVQKILGKKDVARYILCMVSCGGLAMLFLIKGSFLGCIIPGVFLTIMYCIYSKNYNYVWLIGLSFFCWIPILWCASGQSIINFIPWMQSLFPIISGYTEAMSAKGKSYEVVGYLCVMMLLVISFFIVFKFDFIKHNGYSFIMRISFFKKNIVDCCVLMFAILTLFIAFKAGFVRHDGHALTPAFALPLVVILLYMNIGIKKFIIPICVTFIFALAVYQQYYGNFIQSVPPRAVNIVRHAYYGLKARCTGTAQLRYVDRLKTLAKDSFLLSGTTDIYSFDQSPMLAAGNTWKPRPVFQSYSAYTPVLAEKNAAHLRGASAPDNVLFRLQPIDGRFPALEDGASWPAIADNYSFTGMQKNLAVFRKRAILKEKSEFSELVHTSVQLGASLRVPETTSPVFVKLDIQPTWFGKLIGMAFKPARLWIHVVCRDGTTYRYRLIANMAQSGFFLSPLVTSTSEFAMLMTGGSHRLSDRKVVSFSIVGNKHIWRTNYAVSLLAYEGGEKSFEAVEKTLYSSRSAVPAVQTVTNCTGHKDRVWRTLLGVQVHGWVVHSEAKRAADQVYVIARQADGARVWFTANGVDRPDVAQHFSVHQYKRSGYEALLPPGTATEDIGIGYLFDGKYYQCNNGN